MLTRPGAAGGRRLLLVALVPSVSAPVGDEDDPETAAPTRRSPTDRAPPRVLPIRFVGRSQNHPT